MRQDAGLARGTCEDLALGALLALDDLWRTAHEGHAWRLDTWGEGPSLLTLRDLGLPVAPNERRGVLDGLVRLIRRLGARGI